MRPSVGKTTSTGRAKMKQLEAEPAVRYRALLGEGPIWDSLTGRLIWLDFRRQEVHCYDPAAERDDVILVEPTPVSALGPRQSGGWVCAAGRGFGFFDMDDGSIDWIANVPAGDRMNDGACDPVGRFLAGTITFDRRREAALYRLDPQLVVTELLCPVTVSNGLDWTPDGRTLFYVDTPTRHVVGFPYDVDRGTIGDVCYSIDLRETGGNPDGLVVDEEGMIWVALFRAAEVRRYSPDGRLLCVVKLPASNVTSCCFGGPTLSDLYITTAARGLSAEELESEPLAGSLFRVATSTRGQSPRTFAS